MNKTTHASTNPEIIPKKYTKKRKKRIIKPPESVSSVAHWGMIPLHPISIVGLSFCPRLMKWSKLLWLEIHNDLALTTDLQTEIEQTMAVLMATRSLPAIPGGNKKSSECELELLEAMTIEIVDLPEKNI